MEMVEKLEFERQMQREVEKWLLWKIKGPSWKMVFSFRMGAVPFMLVMAQLTSMARAEAEYWKLESVLLHSRNLVTYFTNKLHRGNASAAQTVSIWQGICYLTLLIGASVADAYWGRYWTIAAFSVIHFIGMCALTLPTVIPALRPAECVGSESPSPTIEQSAVFLLGLYLVALGTGGIKPCVSPFGGDQFDDSDPKERVMKESFFDWFYFAICIGIIMATTSLVWIQDNLGWGLGFGIATLFMGTAIAVFLFGTPLYRFQKPRGSPFRRMCQVLVVSCRKWNLELPRDSSLLYETQDSSATEGSYKLEHTDTLKFLGKAVTVSDAEISGGDFFNPWRLCTVTQVEELKTLIHMFPIWATGVVLYAVSGQVSTLFLEQGMMMDTTIGSFTVPPASLSTFDVITGRLGYYLCSFILTVVTYFTTKGGKVGWIPDNLNEGHLDYLFCLSTGIISERTQDEDVECVKPSVNHYFVAVSGGH
ncbi:Proton-dependent oligopeptide transporter family [Parasponia andersonii]|uniref:Proton-dependent oligopeptide transporter family n=1 Tax=Parasponia andersonii TaxID=3476 RepID=A0A2P5E107_PARAD|nr:Proton-dependent oligopeptide transporter family [Parasponia andersonii]